MFYVRVPLSRQIFTNLLLLAVIAGGSIYLTQKNISVLEYKNKASAIQKCNNYFMAHKEEKDNHLMRDMVLRLIHGQTATEMLGDVSFFEWHDDTPDTPIYRREADDFNVPDEFIDAYRNGVFSTSQGEAGSETQSQSFKSLYCTNSDSCTFFTHKRYSIGEKSGIAIYGVRLNGIVNEYKQLVDYTSLIFLEDSSHQTLNEWKSKLLPSVPHILSINVSKFDKKGNLPDLKAEEQAHKETYDTYINNFSAMWGFEREIYTPFYLFGQNLGYMVNFLPKPDIIDILLLPTPENFIRMFCILILLGGVIIYQVHVLFRTYAFMEANTDRIKRYAPTANAGFAQDETLILINMLDSAISTAEKREQAIKKLNKKLALYDYYDPLSSLPNAKWLNEQLIRSIGSYANDNGNVYYLVLFTTSLTDKYLKTDNHLSQMAASILALIGDENCLAMFSENTFALITSNCSDNNAVSNLLDKIKAVISRQVPEEEATFHMHAGIVSIISHTITHTELIRRAQVALQSSLNDKSETDNYTLFSEALGGGATENSLLETSLRKARMSGELIIKYDIVYNLKESAVAGIHAHTYWLRNGTTVCLLDYRDDLIRSGLNIEYNYWKIENCLFDLNELDNKLSRQINIIIDLNLGQLTDPNLIKMLEVLTMKYSIMPSRIYFSITEEDISGDLEAAINAIKALTDNGYRINLDNYGIGYADADFVKTYNLSSVSYSPVLARRITRTEYDRRMITSSLKQILNLGTTLTACDGVDNILTAKTLLASGTDFMTGPLFPQNCPMSQLPEVIASIKTDDYMS